MSKYLKPIAAVVLAAFILTSIPGPGYALSPASKFEKPHAQEQAGSSFEENFEIAKRIIVGLSVSREAEYGMGSGWITWEDGEPVIVTAVHTVRGNGFPKRIYIEQRETDANGDDVLIEDGEIDVEYVGVYPSWKNDLVKLKILWANEGARRLLRNVPQIKLIDPIDVSPGERVFIMGYPYNKKDTKRVYEGAFIGSEDNFAAVQPRVTPGFSGGAILRIDDKEVRLIGFVRGLVSDEGNAISGPGSNLVSNEAVKGQRIPKEISSRFETYDEVDLKRKLHLHNFEIRNRRVVNKAEIGQVVICTDVKPTDIIETPYFKPEHPREMSHFVYKRGVCAIGIRNGKLHMLFANLSSLEEHYFEQIANKIRSLQLESLEIVAFCHEDELKDKEIGIGKDKKVILGMRTLITRHLKPLVAPAEVHVIYTEDIIMKKKQAGDGEVESGETEDETEDEEAEDGKAKDRKFTETMSVIATTGFVRFLVHSEKPDDPARPLVSLDQVWGTSKEPHKLKVLQLPSILLFISAFAAALAYMDPAWADTALFAILYFSRGEGDDSKDGDKEEMNMSERVEAFVRSGFSTEMRDELKDAISEASFDDLEIILQAKGRAEEAKTALFVEILKRLQELALNEKPQIQEKAIDRIIKISEKAEKSFFEYLDPHRLATAKTIPRQLRAKIQCRIFEIAFAGERGSRIISLAENVTGTIGFDNLELQPLADIYISGIFRDEHRHLFGDLFMKSRLEESDSSEEKYIEFLRRVIPKQLTPRAIAGLLERIQDRSFSEGRRAGYRGFIDKFAPEIASGLEGLSLNDDTAEEAIDALLVFSRRYPDASSRPLARLSTEAKLAVDLRKRVQREIIDLHKERPVAAAFDEFEVESLMYARAKGFKSHDTEEALSKRIEGLSAIEIASLEPNAKLQLRGDLVKRSCRLALEGDERALEEFLDFASSGCDSSFLRYFKDIFENFKHDGEKMEYVLKRVIELNFLAKDSRSREVAGRAIDDLYGPSNIPLSLLFYAMRDDRFGGPEQRKYEVALRGKLLPVRIDEALVRMRDTTDVAEFPNLLIAIAEKVDAGPASVSLLQVAYSENVSERLAVIGPLCIMFGRKELSEPRFKFMRRSIQGQLVLFMLKDPSVEVRSRSSDAIVRLGLNNLDMDTLLYLSAEEDVAGDFIISVDAELNNRLKRHEDAKIIVRLIREDKKGTGIIMRRLVELSQVKGDQNSLFGLRILMRAKEISIDDKCAVLYPLSLAVIKDGVRSPVAVLIGGLLGELETKHRPSSLSKRSVSNLENVLSDSRVPVSIRTRLLKYVMLDKGWVLRRGDFLRGLLVPAQGKIFTMEEFTFYSIVARSMVHLRDLQSLPHLRRLADNTADPKFRSYFEHVIQFLRRPPAVRVDPKGPVGAPRQSRASP